MRPSRSSKASRLPWLAVALGLVLGGCTQRSNADAGRLDGKFRSVDSPGASSPAAEATAGVNRRRLLTAIFRDVLEREPTAAELELREAAWAEGRPLREIALALLESEEHRSQTVKLAWQRCSRKAPPEGSVVEWVRDRAFEEPSLATIRARVTAASCTKPAMFGRLSREIRGVEPTAEAVESGALQWAQAPEKTLAALFDSDEHRKFRAVPAYYHRYLRREPSSAEAERGAAAVRERGHFPFVADLLSGDEYAALQRCRPLTCRDAKANCGTLEDGCGGVIDCGGCAPGLECGSERPNTCGMRCEPTTCEEIGNRCGTMEDGCGNILDCGRCGAGESCVGYGGNNRCAAERCEPETCASLGSPCGKYGDGCGGLVDCGRCG